METVGGQGACQAGAHEDSRARDFSTNAGGQPPRVLVTGASGVLGRQVHRIFKARGWTLLGLAYSRATCPLVRCNLFEEEEIAAQFSSFRPDIVVHCAAERRPDVLEKDSAYAMRLNRDVAETVARMCGKHGAWLVYLSTNYVFDGSQHTYSEDAEPRPLSVYGESKLAGELAVAGAHPDSAIVRIPLLYGPIDSVGETSVDALLSTIRKTSRPAFDNWMERFPTDAVDVAQVLEAMAAARLEVRAGARAPAELRGIFHWQANEWHTKYTMAVVVAEIAGVGVEGFVRVDDEVAGDMSAPRPRHQRMLCTRLERLLGIEGNPRRYRSDFAEGLRRYLLPFL